MWDRLEEEKTKLNEEKQKIIQRIHEIESTMNSVDLRPEQIVELGGKSNKYGRFADANFYGIPVTSQFEYEIVYYIKERINLEIPSKMLRDICHASIRALTMAGTFEEARDAYNKFYSLNFRNYGVDIPPRIDDVIKDTKLVADAGSSLNQIEKLSPPKKIELLNE